ncbi:dihydropteroate synthase [bacterium]|nr:dihydropteroate synthase [bacterium]
MGIINTTPDSFFDGGKYNSTELALKQAEKHLSEGADILDVGGYSSRPGADHISENEEISRTAPVVEAIKKHFPESIISIDTFRAQVAKHAIEAGAEIINDISAGEDDAMMFETVAKLKVPYIIMHKKGRPQNMQHRPEYDNVLLEVTKYLSDKILQLNLLGVNDIIADPGFGFGKSLDHNYELLRSLEHLHQLEVPLLVGVSRKSMIYKALETSPEEALNGSTVLHTIALQKGAHLLRVHDVKAAREVVSLMRRLEF